MKVRTGFVSNSSSSSFVCNVCGYVTEVYDGDCGNGEFKCCENGHSFCSGCMKEDSETSEIDMIRAFIKSYKYATDEDKHNAVILDDDKLMEFWESDCQHGDMGYEFHINVPAEHCPVCSLAEISDTIILDYILSNKKKTREFFAKQIRSKYKDLKQLQKYLKK